MSRKICVITGTRAEYGLLRWVMQGIADDPELTLQLIVTGMHLSPEFGLTYREISNDGFHIDRNVEMLTSSDTPVGIAKSMGLGMIGFADALNDLSPDLILVLGDRFEIFAAVSAALVARIPVAHIHGGEATEGAVDEAMRHSITKMSQIHFVAAEGYRDRVIQLGERPDRVHLVGGLGIDSIKRLKLLNREEFEESINVRLGKKSLLVTYHPVTLESDSAESQMTELLEALSGLNDTQLLFTLPNADAGGRIISELIRDFSKVHSNAHVFTSLGQLRYLSCIAHVDGVIGNSSSGLLEVPSFRKPTINIGERQRGRIQAKSVINCGTNRLDIGRAIRRIYDREFLDGLKNIENPYGEGGASEKILGIIKSVRLDNIVKKEFYNFATTIV